MLFRSQHGESFDLCEAFEILAIAVAKNRRNVKSAAAAMGEVAKNRRNVKMPRAARRNPMLASAKPQVRGLVRFCESEIRFGSFTFRQFFAIHQAGTGRNFTFRQIFAMAIAGASHHANAGGKINNLWTIFQAPIRNPDARFGKTAGQRACPFLRRKGLVEKSSISCT